MCQMPNIWHIYHTKHQKCPSIRCVKCAKLLQYATVPSQCWHGTDRSCIIYIIILFSFFSLLFTYISPSLRLLISIFFLICLLWSSSIARRSPLAAQRRRSHQRPPLDAANHLSSLFRFEFFFFFFLFSFFLSLFLAVVWWVDSGCG